MTVALDVTTATNLFSTYVLPPTFYLIQIFFKDRVLLAYLVSYGLSITHHMKPFYLRGVEFHSAFTHWTQGYSSGLGAAVPGAAHHSIPRAAMQELTSVCRPYVDNFPSSSRPPYPGRWRLASIHVSFVNSVSDVSYNVVPVVINSSFIFHIKSLLNFDMPRQGRKYKITTPENSQSRPPTEKDSTGRKTPNSGEQ